MKTEPDWVEHDGSAECPVPEGHDVEMRLRNGRKGRDKTQEDWPRWDHVGADVDIIAYRDWTAFYEQQEQTQWRGPEDGLPPAGAECEYQDVPRNVWRRGTVVAHHQGMAVFVDHDDPAAECLAAVHFRPIQSPEDRAVEAMNSATGYALGAESPALKSIYRAIRDGKIPGVRLENQS